MLIEKKNTAELLPADYNPRKDLKPGDKEYEKLKRSIEQFGYHAFGGSKMTALGQKDTGNPAWIPEEADLKDAVQFLEKLGVVTKRQKG